MYYYIPVWSLLSSPYVNLVVSDLVAATRLLPRVAPYRASRMSALARFSMSVLMMSKWPFSVAM